MVIVSPSLYVDLSTLILLYTVAILSSLMLTTGDCNEAVSLPTLSVAAN